ncbi:stealth family protein [Williamsia sp. Leaf354]|uniref:stealth family protein n=1 Tax=Williamsia sp. Leaf354 TaxID=1736349 RepID=UPI0009EA3AA0
MLGKHASAPARVLRHLGRITIISSRPTSELRLVPRDPGSSLPLSDSTSGAVARLRDRDDIVEFRGRLALRNVTTTPHEATIADLLFVRGVLDAADIGYLLVRGNDDRPVLAVDVTRGPELRAALTAGCAREPFYAKAMDIRGSRLRLVADGGLSTVADARILRVHRPRVEPTSGMHYGTSGAVQIELWSFTDADIVAPVVNSLTRRSIPASEAVHGTVERYGLTWPTIEDMFDAHASDIGFDIDIVFSWVDGSSAEFQAQRAKRMKNYVVGSGDDSAARFRQIDELKYALRSVHMYAPWIRRIFVATDSPRPAWLADDPRVTFVRSEEFFADTSVLPTHNSQAVESQLHRIPGLSEHFLYSNDDMFFARPVSPDMFFSPGGISMFVEGAVRIGLGHNDNERSGFENAARVNRRILRERFGSVTTRHLEHVATPLRKSVMAQMEQEFPEEFAATAASAFRSSENISVTNSLYHYYALQTGQAVVQRGAKVRYIDTTTASGLRAMGKLLPKRAVDFFCLNDGSFPEVDLDVRTATVTDFLERYFPIAGEWES